MTGNQPYDPTTLMRFHISMLSLAAQLEVAAPIGAEEIAAEALEEAVRLDTQIHRSEA